MFKYYKSYGIKVNEDGVVIGKSGNNMTGSLSKKGYLGVCVYLSNYKSKRIMVHRMVAELFVHNPDPIKKTCVNHIDGNKTNNHYTNLEWCTVAENNDHAVNVLGHNKGQTHPRAQIGDQEVLQICELLLNGYRNEEISEIMNISKNIPRLIRNKVNWTHITEGYNFPYGRNCMTNDKVIWIADKLVSKTKYKDIIRDAWFALDKRTITNIKRKRIRPDLLENYEFE